jgi:hypothetical protein
VKGSAFSESSTKSRGQSGEKGEGKPSAFVYNAVPKNLSKNAQQLLFKNYEAREKMHKQKEAADLLEKQKKKSQSKNRASRGKGDNATSDMQSVATTAAQVDENAYEKLPELDAGADMAKSMKPRPKKQNLVHKREPFVQHDKFGTTQPAKCVYKPINYTLNKLGCLNYDECTSFKDG